MRNVFINRTGYERNNKKVHRFWMDTIKSFRVCDILWNGLDKSLYKMFDTIAFTSVHTFLFITLQKIWFAVGSYDKRYYSLDGNEELSTTNKLKCFLLYYRAERRSLTSQVFYFTSQLSSSLTKPCSSVVHFLSLQETYYLAMLVNNTLTISLTYE